MTAYARMRNTLRFAPRRLVCVSVRRVTTVLVLAISVHSLEAQAPSAVDGLRDDARAKPRGDERGDRPIVSSASSWALAIASSLRAVHLPSRAPTVLATTQSPTPQCMCTMSFAMVTIALVDPAGKPVSDARVRVRRVSTNTSREVAEELPGMYTIADDMLRDSLRAEGEAFEVTVRWKNRTRRVTVQVGTKDPAPRQAAGSRAAAPPDCRCHVRRLSGPDRIILR